MCQILHLLSEHSIYCTLKECHRIQLFDGQGLAGAVVEGVAYSYCIPVWAPLKNPRNDGAEKF